MGGGAAGPKCLAAACPGSKEIPFLVHGAGALARLARGAVVDVVLCSLAHGEEAVVASEVPCRLKGVVERGKLFAVAAPTREALSRTTRTLMTKCGEARASSSMTRYVEVRLGPACLFRMVFFTKFRDRTANADFSRAWTDLVSRTWKACERGDGCAAHAHFMEFVAKTGNVMRLHLHQTALEKWARFEPGALDLVSSPTASSSTASDASSCDVGVKRPRALSSPPSRTASSPVAARKKAHSDADLLGRADGMHGALEGLLRLHASSSSRADASTSDATTSTTVGRPRVTRAKCQRVLIQIVQDEDGRIRVAHLDCAYPEEVLRQALENGSAPFPRRPSWSWGAPQAPPTPLLPATPFGASGSCRANLFASSQGGAKFGGPDFS